MNNHPAMLWRWQPIRIALAIFFLSLAVCGITAATTKKPPSQPVNINPATAEELQHVPGIGPATAVKILQMRKSYGASKAWTICWRFAASAKSGSKKCADI